MYVGWRLREVGSKITGNVTEREERVQMSTAVKKSERREERSGEERGSNKTSVSWQQTVQKQYAKKTAIYQHREGDGNCRICQHSFLGETAWKNKKTLVKMELLTVTIAWLIKRNVERVLPLSSRKKFLGIFILLQTGI